MAFPVAWVKHHSAPSISCSECLMLTPALRIRFLEPSEYILGTVSCCNTRSLSGVGPMGF